MARYAELINVRSLSPTAKLSAASGLLWALIAWIIGHYACGPRIWGGIAMAPLIGILIGRLSWPMHDKPRWVQVAGSLFYLYVAAACFGVGMAFLSPVLDPPERFLDAVIANLVGVLWGLTFGGWALVLWPLSFFNHRRVWQADADRLWALPEIRTTATAVRRAAVGILALAMFGFLASALFQAAMATVGSSASTMPWWVATDLLGWSDWFVLGILVWLSAPVLAFGAALASGSGDRSTTTYRELIGVVGFAIFVFPLLSFAASAIVTAIKVSLVQSWATEGLAWTSDYFRNVFRRYLPWFLVGGGMICVRRLMGRRR